MGTAAAYWISRTPGLKVVLVDRYVVGNEFCSSNDANRVFRYSYGKDEFYTRMAVKSLDLWKQLENETGNQILIPSGLLMVEGEDAEANSFNENSYTTLRKMGLGAERMDGPELKKKFSQFSAESAIFDPHAGVLLASKALSILRKKSEEGGVRILENLKATRLHAMEEVEVETSTGETVRCAKAILTIGSWSRALCREGLPSMTPSRQQVVYLRPRTGLEKYRPESFPIFFADQYYGIPAAGIEGVKVSHKELRDPVDPDQAKRTVDAERVEECRTLCQRYIPELGEGEIAHTKVCLYDMTKNSDFVIGPDPENFSVIYGYGFSGHGFKFAPLIGKILAELAGERPLSFNIERLSPAISHEALVAGPPY